MTAQTHERATVSGSLQPGNDTIEVRPGNDTIEVRLPVPRRLPNSLDSLNSMLLTNHARVNYVLARVAWVPP